MDTPMTAEFIFGEDIPEYLQENPDVVSEIGAVYQFILEGDGGGRWFLDCTAETDWVGRGDIADPDCTVTMKASDFVDLYTGKLSGPQAFLTGKLRVEGEMSLALDLSKILAAAID